MSGESEARLRQKLESTFIAAPPEEESSSHTDEDAPRSKSKKRKRVKIHLRKVIAQPWVPSPAQLSGMQWCRAKRPHRSYVVIPGALSADDVELIRAVRTRPTAVACNDRHRNLDFRHSVERIERALKEDGHPGRELYDRLLRMMAWADQQLWSKLGTKIRKVYPEIEFIEYDARSGEPKYIEPHVDNDSVITMLALLTPQSDFVGGINCFKGTQAGAPKRQNQLQCTDAVIFRGESLTHWITPVTAGVRAIIQIELSKK